MRPAFPRPVRLPATAATLAAKAPGPASLNDVACLRSNWCMAVGSTATQALTPVAWIWAHGAWHKLKNPPGLGLTGVSCSTRTFCLTTGLLGRAELWNGATCQVMTAQPEPAITAPSCASSQLCAVINGTGFHGSGALAETWLGHTWKSWNALLDHRS